MNATSITIALAATGYVATYLNSVRLENRKSRLKYISDQIQYLYGPLFSLTQASGRAWVSFRSRCRPGKAFFGQGSPPTEGELKEWRLWMSEVFMPLNLQMEKVIIENAHLIEGAGMPKSFQELLAHVEVYRAVLKKWELNDVSEHASYLNFPADLSSYVGTVFAALLERQTRIINSIF
jgi:hypothetical protein